MSTRLTDAPRVLRMLPSLPQPARSGIDLRHQEQVHVLAERGPTAVFALLGDAPALPSPLVWRTTSDESTTQPLTGATAARLAREGAPIEDSSYSETTARELLELVHDFEPDVVVIGPIELGRYVEAVKDATDIPVVLDLHETVAVRFAISQVDEHRGRALLARLAARTLADLERRAVAAADQVWMASAMEADALRAAYPTAVATVVPNTVDVDSYPRSPREDPRALVYPGGFFYVPNAVAARVLVEEIVPRVTGATLVLVGTQPTPWMRELDDPRVTVTGGVPDVRPYLTSAGVLPMPLRVGGGTRLKALEAFAAGLPVVSTAKGVEGLSLDAGEHYLGAETAAEFATAIEHLAEDREHADGIVDRAYDLVGAEFSRRALRARITEALAAAVTSEAPS